MAYTYIQSLHSKYLELISFAKAEIPDFILDSESWLYDAITDNTIAIPGYSVFRQDSSTTIGHGGVCIFVRNAIVDQFSVTPFSCASPGVDNIFIDFAVGNNIFLTICCVYRPRPSTYDSKFAKYLRSVLNIKKTIFIAGDFNLPDIHWPISTFPDICLFSACRSADPI